MAFHTRKLNFQHGLILGSNKAPIKIVEFINWRCPDAKAYELNIAPTLNTYVKQGKVQRIIKHFDKHKAALEKGNILNQYIDYTDAENAYLIGRALFKYQDKWGNFQMQDIPHFAEDMHLTLQNDNRKLAKQINREASVVGVTAVPTVFVGKQAFVETFTMESFIDAIESQL